MTREEARKLLGGYATGTLTSSEREALFAAALEDQELFDALAKEEALREVLAEPAARTELLAALEEPEPRAAWWRWRPLAGALAMAGIALAAVGVWRFTREHPAPVIVARMEQAPAPPTAIPPSAPASAPASPAPAPKAALPRRQVEPAKPALPAATPAIAGSLAEPAPAPKAAINQPVETSAAPQPPPPPKQQALEFTPPAPAPRQAQAQLQAQADRLKMESTSARAIASAGFRDAQAGAASAGIVAGNSAALLAAWTILRDGKEAPPGTPLDAGETIRLRIATRIPGTLTLKEGENVLATASVENSAPFDTPPLPYASSGVRLLRLTLTPAAGKPLTWTITLRYGN